MPIPGEPDALHRACPVRRGAWGDGLFGSRALCLLYIKGLQADGGERAGARLPGQAVTLWHVRPHR
jgi:hypothetical protein